jgi:hypothetical protein
MSDTEPQDERLARMLQGRRPEPSAEFASGLRQRLTAERWRPHRPAHLWQLVAAWICCGLALLALAALGAAGSGPFA